ncbi:MAG TPA: cytochrome P450 [Acidimicrobiaceae bacterium]|nr:cytochrome P450 [Acidimicrobiaceae bacterium]
MSEVAPLKMVDFNPQDIPLEDFDISQRELWAKDLKMEYFARLRDEAPVHFCKDSEFGPYWSLTRYADIMEVDSNWQDFSSEPAITIIDPEEDFPLPMFIAMDQPRHDVERKTVSPVVSTRNLAGMEALIRERTGKVLDSLPIGEEFDWVDKVSIELTTQMLATLFDFPFEERRKLTRWSDVATAAPGSGIIDTEEQRREELIECLVYFTHLWEERKKNPTGDFVSMLAHGEETKDLEPMAFLGNLILLIVGGNDTTRNSMSAGVHALNMYPAEFDKLRADPSVIPNMVAEIIRWQTPLAYMRRTANNDCEIGGKQIKAGDQILMWYLSGNRDEEVFERAEELIIDRKNARNHMAFGFGIHRCMGNRVAEMQLRILWEEILKRFDHVEVVGEPERTFSSFVRGYTKLPVRLHKKA